MKVDTAAATAHINRTVDVREAVHYGRGSTDGSHQPHGVRLNTSHKPGNPLSQRRCRCQVSAVASVGAFRLRRKMSTGHPHPLGELKKSVHAFSGI